MGKQRSWFSWVKRQFLSEPKSKATKKSKRWRWGVGGHKQKQCPALAAPPKRMIDEAIEEQRKHVMAVAIATAAAAEAAVAAARAAAEVVRLTGLPQMYQEYETRTRNSAAIIIQAAYRAYLARKALRALKGLVRLQAMVRGQIVRRRVTTKRRSLPSIAKKQSQVHELRVPTINESCKDGVMKQFLSPKEEFEEKKIKLRCSSQKNWDYTLFSKEMEALWLQKHEANLERECKKKYSFSHRERRNDQNLGTLITKEEDGRWINQLEQRIEPGECRRRQLSNLRSTLHSKILTKAAQMKLRNAPKQESVEELNFSLAVLPRRSFCLSRQNSIGEESSLPNSPVFPSYMAATESAKAKARSVSTPKQRRGLFDTCADYNSPCTQRLSSWSSLNGEFSKF